MTHDERERIIIPDEKGEEHLFDVLLTFDIDEMDESYIALVPAEQKEDEEVEVYVFRYKENNDNDISLFSIDTDEEWDMVEEMLYTLMEEKEL